MSAIKKIFVSSSFHESFEFGFVSERKVLKDAIRDDLTWATDFSLDYNKPAILNPEENSITKVGKSNFLILLLGRRYSDTVRKEYEAANQLKIPILCYVFPLNENDNDYNKCKDFIEGIEKDRILTFSKVKDLVTEKPTHLEIINIKSGLNSRNMNEVEISNYCEFLAQRVVNDLNEAYIGVQGSRNFSTSYSSVPPIPEDYFPRNEHTKAIKERLEENRICVVSGMGGVGKTTLAIALGNDSDLRKEFKDGIYYLKIGQTPNLEEKQGNLLLHLENRDDKGSYLERIKKDFADRKALLILDDIWNPKDFLPFDITSHENHSKILITTRYKDILNFYNYEIEQLNENESLAVLKQKIGWSTTDSELEIICKRMSKKCGGLPLAISAVAKVLAEKIDLNRWQDVEKDFNRILEEEEILADEKYSTVNASIQLSVEYLDENTRDRYFSLCILLNIHSFATETLSVYWGSDSRESWKSLKNASLLTEQIGPQKQERYRLHDLQKAIIERETTGKDLTRYKEQFIQNYREKYASAWHKISPLEHHNFYHNYLEICEDLNEQSLAKEISEDVLYNNAHISLPIVQKIINFLGIDLKKEAPKILKTNRDGNTVVMLLRYLTPEEKKNFANKYLEKFLKQNFEDIDRIITTQCLKEADKELTKDFANEYLEKFLKQNFKDVNSQITTQCLKEADKELTKNFANKYLEKAIKHDFEGVNSLLITQCFKEADYALKKKFANSYLEKSLSHDVKDANSQITTQCFHKADERLKKKFANSYLEKFLKQNFKDVNSQITTQCLKEADKELTKDFANEYLEKFLKQNFKDVNSHITIQCLKEADKELTKNFASKYVKQDNKDIDSLVKIQCYKEIENFKQIASSKIFKKTKQKIKRIPNKFFNKKRIQDFKKGDIVKGIVKNITDYGVFMNLGAIDGLLHITDITWTRISHPSEACAIGDTIEVVIMDFDLEKNRVSLGLKQKTADPWEGIKKYKIGSIVNGKIISIAAYGIFVEIEKGIEGLVYNTEISWSKKITGIEDITQKVGDDIKVVVKEIDKDKRRISLSVKELTPNPWNGVSNTVKKDSVIEGVIQNIVEFGLFVTLPQGVDGLVHISDIDWNNRHRALMDIYKKGQDVKVKVISIDTKAERIALGIKQLRDNPWIGIEKKLAAGDLVKGKVQYISEFGLFVETAERIEGLLHINKMDSSLNSKEQLERKYAVGDTIGVKILKIEASTQKLAFILPKSSKVKLETEEKATINQKKEFNPQEYLNKTRPKYVNNTRIIQCFEILGKNDVLAIQYAENYIKQGNYKSHTLNSCLYFLAKDNEVRKIFAEKELEKISSNIDYLSKEINTKTLIIHTEIDNYQLREKVVFEQLKLEFEKFPSYSKKSFLLFNIKDFFNSNRSLINACLLVCEGQESIAEYSRKILQHWEKEIAFRHRERYYHIHIITALKHPLMGYNNIGIAKQILQKDNDELCKNIEDRDFYFISFDLDNALQELLQKHILSYKDDVIEKKNILNMLEETVNIRKKFYEMNPEYKTVTYTQSLNTLSYFHQIHNQQKEAISYKQEATNLAEKICEENPNEILIERQAQYKTELQELTNENTEKNATD